MYVGDLSRSRSENLDFKIALLTSPTSKKLTRVYFKYVRCEFDQIKGRCPPLRNTPAAPFIVHRYAIPRESTRGKKMLKNSCLD